jgi:hypothetical protein
MKVLPQQKLHISPRPLDESEFSEMSVTSAVLMLQVARKGT